MKKKSMIRRGTIIIIMKINMKMIFVILVLTKKKEVRKKEEIEVEALMIKNIKIIMLDVNALFFEVILLYFLFLKLLLLKNN